MHELRKFFKVGDHVKVVAGRYEGDTGMVVKMESSLAIVFSDLTMSEVGEGGGEKRGGEGRGREGRNKAQYVVLQLLAAVWHAVYVSSSDQRLH